MKEKDLINSYVENSRLPDVDYTHHEQAIRKMVERAKLAGLLKENPEKWERFDKELANWEEDEQSSSTD